VCEGKKAGFDDQEEIVKNVSSLKLSNCLCFDDRVLQFRQKTSR
jgi:hypothetical protein